MNSFGTLFKFTTWGESHGPAIGVVVDGCQSLIELSESDIQPYLDKRKPGISKFVTQRREADGVKILSGVYEGKTTGHPISMIIENTDAKSKDYSEIENKFRPGHADYTYQMKYGIRDPRGGGRSSARETACRVAAGAVARKILNGVTIRGAVVQIGPHKINRANWNWDEVNNNPFFTPDAAAVPVFEKFLDDTRMAGQSAGAVIEVVASGVPVGWGEPVYGKLDAKLAEAMMSINAVKAVEIGDGFGVAELTGQQNADEIRAKKGEGRGENITSPLRGGHHEAKPSDGWGDVNFLSNHAGGILGGISSGQDIVVRFAVKPTSSILTPVQTIDADGNNTEIQTKGRHDPCVGIRAVPIGEAMMACVLADAMLIAKVKNSHLLRDY